MICELTIRKLIKARDISQGMEIIKEKYPYARMITYSFDKNFIFQRPKDYKNRTMQICFIKDIRIIKILLENN